MRLLKLVGLFGLLAFCTAGFAQPADAKKLRDQLTGDAAGRAANNPQCKLYTPQEIAKYVGEAVKPGENAAGGSGCVWSTRDGESDALVQVVGASYLVEPKQAKGYKPLPAIGTKAYVVPEMGGWTAGVVLGNEAVLVSVTSKTASEAVAVSLLQETIKRRKP